VRGTLPARGSGAKGTEKEAQSHEVNAQAGALSLAPFSCSQAAGVAKGPCPVLLAQDVLRARKAKARARACSHERTAIAVHKCWSID